MARNRVDPTTRVIRSEEPIGVEVDRTVVMMSLAQGMYFGLEGAGSRIWALLDGPRSAAQLSEQLQREFDVDGPTCLRDTCEFLDSLLHAHLIRIHDETAGPVLPPSGR